MNRYLLFAGDDYYPRGGFKDFQGDFDTVKDALKFIANHSPDCSFDWYQIVDSKKNFKIVYEV